MRLLTSFLAGGMFGFGLMIAGMTDTAVVQGWLDFFGNWNPTLAFVLGGAIIPMAIAWRVTRRLASPVHGAAFPPMPEPILDARLIGGAALFGLGWGLVGLCPGPAMASLGYNGFASLEFFAAMAAGMIATHLVMRTQPTVV